MLTTVVKIKSVPGIGQTNQWLSELGQSGASESKKINAQRGQTLRSLTSGAAAAEQGLSAYRGGRGRYVDHAVKIVNMRFSRCGGCRTVIKAGGDAFHFTHADTKGKWPAFVVQPSDMAGPFMTSLTSCYWSGVSQDVFGADMQVELVFERPVDLDTKNR